MFSYIVYCLSLPISNSFSSLFTRIICSFAFILPLESPWLEKRICIYIIFTIIIIWNWFFFHWRLCWWWLFTIWLGSIYNEKNINLIIIQWQNKNKNIRIFKINNCGWQTRKLRQNNCAKWLLVWWYNSVVLSF